MADEPTKTEPAEAAGAYASVNPPATIQDSQSDAHVLYLEQQRRLACPGCGEEAFLG